MVPGAPVATSGILFAVPAFREWLRLSVRTTYHSPIPLSICGAPCRPALCPSRPPTFPPSDSPALRPSRSALCLRLRLRLSARTPFAKLLAVLPSAHRVLQPSRSAHCLPPRPRLSARTPFARLLAVPPSRRSALCPFRPPPVPSSVSFALRSFFCLARLFLFLTPSSIWMGISGEDFPRGQLFASFQAPVFNTLLYTLYI